MLNRTPHRVSRLKGFTLIELLVVISIIALLVGILLPVLTSARAQGRLITSRANVRSIAQAHLTYQVDFKDRFMIARDFDFSGGAFQFSFAGFGSGPIVDDQPFTVNLLIPYLGGTEETDGGFSEVFRCPSVNAGNGHPDISIRNEFTGDTQHHYMTNSGVTMNYGLIHSEGRLVSRTSLDVESPSEARLQFDWVFANWREQRADLSIDPEDVFPHSKAGTAINTAMVDGSAESLDFEEFVELSPNLGGDQPFQEFIDVDRFRNEDLSDQDYNPFITEGWRPWLNN